MRTVCFYCMLHGDAHRLVDDGTALVCNIQNGCFLGSTCTANDLAGITNMTRNDTVCYVCDQIIVLFAQCSKLRLGAFCALIFPLCADCSVNH